MSHHNGNGLCLEGTGAAYVRVSDDAQDTERQHESIHAFEKRHGAAVAEGFRFVDQGWARDLAARRPEFQRMLKLVDAGRVRWVVVDKIDRFGFADEWELVELITRLHKAGCRLYDTRGDEWTERGLLGFFKAGLAGHHSHDEQMQKSYRSLGGMVQQAKAGEWMGGPPKLGFDVGCFDRATGHELYRVVFEGRDVVGTTPRKGKVRPVYHVRRLKVYADGRTERFDGNVTSFRTNEDTQVVRIVPSLDPAKLDAVRGVFGKYATEAVTFAGLAKWLNRQGVRNSFGQKFQSRDISKMLTDEAYLGYPTFSKRRNGRFHRHDADGGITELEPGLRGKDTESDPADIIKSGRRLYEPLVDRPTWDAVQKKLRGRDKVMPAPKNPHLYLAGLVVCDGCGRLMVARADRQEYYCGTWDKARVRGALDDCPCQRNGVKQEVLEHYISEFLPEVQRRLDMLKAGAGDGRLVRHLEGEQHTSWRAFNEGFDRLTAYLAEHCPDDYDALLREEHEAQAANDADAAAQAAGEWRGADMAAHVASLPPEEQAVWQKALEKAKRDEPPACYLPDDVADRLRLYHKHYDADALEAEIARLDAEHTRMLNRWADAPGRLAKDKARELVEELDGKIEALRQQQQDLAKVVDQHYRMVHDLDCQVADALKAMRDPASAEALRRRAEVLRGLLVQIRCRFQNTGKGGRGGKGGFKSKPASVEFLPVAGDAIKVDVGANGRRRSQGKP
jgi:DNA invertase Pin-like site-specific DNA recombinase